MQILLNFTYKKLTIFFMLLFHLTIVTVFYLYRLPSYLGRVFEMSIANIK